MPPIEGTSGKTEIDYKQMPLQDLANVIKKRLQYYHSGELNEECSGVNAGRTQEIIENYSNEISELLSIFFNSEKESMRTKVEIQREIFLDELNRYLNGTYIDWYNF